MRCTRQRTTPGPSTPTRGRSCVRRARAPTPSLAIVSPDRSQTLNDRPSTYFSNRAMAHYFSGDMASALADCDAAIQRAECGLTGSPCRPALTRPSRVQRQREGAFLPRMFADQAHRVGGSLRVAAPRQGGERRHARWPCDPAPDAEPSRAQLAGSASTRSVLERHIESALRRCGRRTGGRAGRLTAASPAAPARRSGWSEKSAAPPTRCTCESTSSAR